ncbi:hypothetical protein E2C01_094408 [Portunus trituberculatus]|uniref:Uncharacterized protein n=1 Tax=Portunus trituberculatus TaxID=210409 RepID=A0A5B7K363_PORTR|nr:hypothetical protein [Portunus trituberculatus]
MSCNGHYLTDRGALLTITLCLQASKTERLYGYKFVMKTRSGGGDEVQGVERVGVGQEGEGRQGE